MAKISLSSMPGQHATKVLDFPRLDGGLNLWELDYRLDTNQSPEMKNLWWQDGVLQCRDGQMSIFTPTAENWGAPGVGFTCAQEPFWGNAFFHIDDRICYLPLPHTVGGEPVVLTTGVPENRGTFFRYGDDLFYKNRGAFIRIRYTPTKEKPFEAASVLDEAHTPVIALNASPTNGAGDLYQPENRISPLKTVWYNAAEKAQPVTIAGDGSKTEFEVCGVDEKLPLIRVDSICRGTEKLPDTDYTVDLTTCKVTFKTAPAAEELVVNLVFGITEYQLPVTEVDAVTEVVVDDTVLEAEVGYKVDLKTGLVSFTAPPPVHNPAKNNTVHITYSKENPDAAASIMDCPYATVYGAGVVCIVLGGCEAQPNAFFWNSNDEVAMDPGYWPMSYYNLAGDTEDHVTGFGQQHGSLILFKVHSLGRVGFDVETLDGRDSIALTYEPINTRIGCDLPWTIQLVENNLVFCNTLAGVHIVRDSSAAYENNVECISRNVNGTAQRIGLLDDLRRTDRDLVCSFDDDQRYWIGVNNHVYLWDYQLSAWSKPSWFYFTEVPGVAFLRDLDTAYHLSRAGRITQFARVFADYGAAIEKVYQFPPQSFGTYDRLKDVMQCNFAVRSDTDTTVKIQYSTDYETRDDLTNISSVSWRLAPRNLKYRILSTQKFAQVAKRKPGCRHIQHFAMRLSNNEVAQDLSILSAQIYFRYLGRDR